MARGVHRPRARAALWNYSLFFYGEDAVADNLSPFIDAAPREEQKYFLATQQVDEARHAVFFKRFMREVVGRRRRHDRRRRCEATEPQLTWGFRKTFDAARQDGRRAAPRPLAHQAGAGRDALPHRRRGDARPARPALHRRLPRRSATCCPASATGCATSRSTSSATSASASSCCADLARGGPRGAATPSPSMLREVLPYTLARVRAAGLGPRATPSASASRSRRSTRRARARSRPSCAPPGCRSSRCPGRRATRSTCRRASARERGLAMLAGAAARRAERPAARATPRRCALLFDAHAPRRSTTRTRARGPFDDPVGVRRRRAVAPAASTTARPRPRRAGAARRPRAPLPLRGLGRHHRGPARPGARAGDRPAAPARDAARPVAGARHLLIRRSTPADSARPRAARRSR